MAAYVQYILSGMMIGAIYSLVALGFHVMWSAVRAVNFAHGDTLMLGAVLAVVLMWSGVTLRERLDLPYSESRFAVNRDKEDVE